MNMNGGILGQVAFGAASGLLGTLAIQTLMSARQKMFPRTVSPLREDPGEFMAGEVEEALPRFVRQAIPDAVEAYAPKALAVAYGLAFAGLYAVVRPGGGSPLMDGVVLGTACWAVGYLGWLPALGLLPPVWRQTTPQALAPVIDHVAYGIATVASYDWLRRQAEKDVPTAASAWGYEES